MSGWDHEENSPAPPPKHRTLDECLIEEQQKDLAAKDARIVALERLVADAPCYETALARIAALERGLKAAREENRKAAVLLGVGDPPSVAAALSLSEEIERLKATADTLRAALVGIIQSADTINDADEIARRALAGEKP